VWDSPPPTFGNCGGVAARAQAGNAGNRGAKLLNQAPPFGAKLARYGEASRVLQLQLTRTYFALLPSIYFSKALMMLLPSPPGRHGAACHVEGEEGLGNPGDMLGKCPTVSMDAVV